MAGVLEGYPKRGEIFWASLDQDSNIDSEQLGHRPVLIISTNIVNQSLSTVTIAAMTKQIRNGSDDFTMRLALGDPLEEASTVLLFHVRTISNRRLQKRIAVMRTEQMEELNAKLKLTWELQ